MSEDRSNLEEITFDRDYAWKYFELHAEQRIKTFHFYVLIATFVTGASFAYLKNSNIDAFVSPTFYLLTLFSFVFWKLDQRNKDLIAIGEDALKKIESRLNSIENSQDRIHLFLLEEKKTKEKKRFPSAPIIEAHLSYSDCFKLVFLSFGTLGFICGTICIINP
ncbi:hypothetical protein P886_0709 [Alteromonadaceae bacterium 2753L.S.0a.02]|nr:hypothetical protein P886_0709 [Alteromonadaceae bacterium 2753L.S.0a.02]